MTRWWLVGSADILIQTYPNTMNARWHEVESVDVIEKPQNDWSDWEKYEIWTQKHRPITFCDSQFSTSRHWK